MKAKTRIAAIVCLPIVVAAISLAVSSKVPLERPNEAIVEYSLVDSVVLSEDEGCEIVSVNVASIEKEQLIISGFMDNSITFRDIKSGAVTFHFELKEELVDSLFPQNQREVREIKGYIKPDSQQAYSISRKCIRNEELLARIQHYVRGYRIISDDEIVLLTLVSGPCIISRNHKQDTTVLGLPALLRVDTHSKRLTVCQITLYPYNYVCGSYYLNPACDTIIGGLMTLKNNIDNPKTMFRYSKPDDNTYIFAKREATPWEYAIEEPVVFWKNDGVCLYSHGVEPYLYYMEDRIACALPRGGNVGEQLSPDRIAIRSISESCRHLCVFAMEKYGNNIRYAAHLYHPGSLRYIGTATFENISRIIEQIVLDENDYAYVIARSTTGERNYLMYKYKIIIN
ncbi:MAG: hypothetical protein M5R41_05580 [Bacteroidia bacterium]|nr:hypothetical protein [Bacteroidia bacterium]